MTEDGSFIWDVMDIEDFITFYLWNLDISLNNWLINIL